MQNARLGDSQAGIKIAGKNINNLRYAHDTTLMAERCLLLGRKATANLDNMLESRDITLLTKVHIIKMIIFPVVMYRQVWELHHEEGWELQSWCIWTVVFEKTLEGPMISKEIKPVDSKGNQPWIFIGRTAAKAEAPILWPPDAKSWLIGKNPGCWERLRAGGKEGYRGWDSWLASRTQRTWIQANSRRQWRTKESGILQSMRSQRVRLNLATEQQNPRQTFVLFLFHKCGNWDRKLE